MRILHLANHCDEVGNGIMNVAVDVACRQADLGHRLAFASAGGAYVELLRRYQVEHFLIPQPWRRPLKLTAGAFALRRLIRQFTPDIVHAHMMTGAVLARLVRGAARYGLVTTVHNEWQRSAVLMGVGDRVIAVSEQVRDQMQRRGIPARKLGVVRNATLGSPRRPPLPASVGQPLLQRPALVSIAGMFFRKGVAELIEAFATIVSERHTDAILYLIGDGPDRPAFEKLASSYRVRDRIRFVGFVRDPRPYLAEADVFVLASRADPSPLVIPEAREAGCAIVATAVGGIPEALENGEAGILVPPHDSQSLAAAIDRLLAHPEQRAEWQRRSRSNLGWLHLDRAVDETLAIYDEARKCQSRLAANASGGEPEWR
ncbi:MAG: glycosyltransferase family 4 protein [Alphaproteobacteria bacterium]|nr:glycosyltransferase family 4 protein [Alphaproteobacteria bacterium]MBV9860770.1 glycosyltransferase family 4 protein [Alphaproteobacteria bacterium]